MSDTPSDSGKFTVIFPLNLSPEPMGPATSVTVGILNLQHVTLTDSVSFSFLFETSIAYPSVSGQAVITAEVPYAGSLAVPGTVAGMMGNMGVEIAEACFDTASRLMTVTFAMTVTTKSLPSSSEIDDDIGII